MKNKCSTLTPKALDAETDFGNVRASMLGATFHGDYSKVLQMSKVIRVLWEAGYSLAFNLILITVVILVKKMIWSGAGGAIYACVCCSQETQMLAYCPSYTSARLRAQVQLIGKNSWNIATSNFDGNRCNKIRHVRLSDFCCLMEFCFAGDGCKFQLSFLCCNKLVGGILWQFLPSAASVHFT